MLNTSHGWGISARALRNGSADWVQFWCVGCSGGGLRGAGCLCRCPQSRVPGVKGVILLLLVKKVILPFLTTEIFDWGPGGHLRRCLAPRNPPPLVGWGS